MNKLKEIFMYLLALIVLLAPAIILGWVGGSLLGWWGGIVGVIVGLIIFGFSLNKIAAQEADNGETDEQAVDTSKLEAKS